VRTAAKFFRSFGNFNFHLTFCAWFPTSWEQHMKKLALVLTMISALFVAAASPAEAHGWRGHWRGPGIGFGLVAGAVAAGLAADAYYGPVGYGPAYGYYRPRVVRRAYYGPYAYAPPPPAYWYPWW
jgi:hypothetical protein